MVECVNCAKFKGCDLSSPNVNECADYKETLTNENYLRSLTTEQLAEVLWEKINVAFNSGYACCNLKQDKDYVGRYKRFKEWLKQQHNS